MLLDNMNDTNLSVLMYRTIFDDENEIIRRCVRDEYVNRFSILFIWNLTKNKGEIYDKYKKKRKSKMVANYW